MIRYKKRLAEGLVRPTSVEYEIALAFVAR